MNALASCLDAPALAEAIAQRCDERCGEQPTQHGENWQVCCPAHEDTNPSLSIRPVFDRVLLHCFAGCTPEAVVSALGLTMADLFVQGQAHTNGHKQIMQVYDYHDASGALLHQTVRYQPKDFKQRRPDPARPGEYLWNLKGIKPVIYRLPSVLDAIQHGKTIYLCEGEKDCENLQLHLPSGEIATTNPMGAKYWRKAYSDMLRSAHIVLLPDNDEAGRERISKVVQSLHGIAASVKVVDLPGLPEKGDVSTWLDQGHTGAELEALADATPLWAPVATTSEPPPSPPPSTTPPPSIDPAADLDTVSPCTHVANARRIKRKYAQTLRYVLGRGWIVWTGQFWRPDPTADGAFATGFVSGLARSIAEEAAILYAAAANTPTDDERKALYARAEARGKWAFQSENATVIAAGLKLAKRDLLIEHDQIDRDPWLFNCQNCTIDLRTGQKRNHDPADLITHLAPVTYDASATCPTWEKFLREVFADDPVMVAFIQRALGWSLTGVVRDRALFFLYGQHGNNGKTTLVEAFRDLLGTCGEESFGYARKVDVTTFMKSKNHDDNLRKTCQLTGTRFVYSSEIDEEHRLNEQLIKDMTGGDTLEARRLYHEPFNFKPTFKPWMYGNHKPEIRGTDDALWGRVKLVEFEMSFADRIDLTLPDKLRAEMSGILNWALKGCLTWQQEGLKPPEKVRTATQKYREEQDTIGRFIHECCQTGQTYMTCKASRLYAAYCRWADGNDHEVLNQKRFGTYLTAHGYSSDNNATGGGIIRKNIDLLKADESEKEQVK